MAILIAYFLTYYRYWFYFNYTRCFFLLNNPFGPNEGYICIQTTNQRRVIYSRNYNQQLVSPGYGNSCSKKGLTCAVSLPVEFLGASRTYVARIYIFTITVSAQNVSSDWVYLKDKVSSRFISCRTFQFNELWNGIDLSDYNRCTITLTFHIIKNPFNSC